MRKDPIYVDIGENNFCIRPFTAFDGGYAALFVMKKLLPMLKAVAGGNEKNDQVNAVLDADIGDAGALDWDKTFAAIEPIIYSIDRTELNEFMELCLGQIEIRMKAGYMPLYKHGVFADEEIGYSTFTCFRLCFEAVKPLVADFFAENGLNLSQLFKRITSPSAQ